MRLLIAGFLVQVQMGEPRLINAVLPAVLLPGNRGAAKALCELTRGPGGRPPIHVEDIIPPYADTHPA